MALIQSTIRIALGFMAGNTAAILARGVLISMLLDQLRVATVLLCLGIGGSYWAWHAFASAVDGKAQANPGPAVVKAPASSQPPGPIATAIPCRPGPRCAWAPSASARFPSISHIVYSPDGRLVVTDNRHSRPPGLGCAEMGRSCARSTWESSRFAISPSRPMGS